LSKDNAVNQNEDRPEWLGSKDASLDSALQPSGSELPIQRELPACTFCFQVGHRAREDCFYDINSSSFCFYPAKRKGAPRAVDDSWKTEAIRAFATANAPPPNDFFL